MMALPCSQTVLPSVSVLPTFKEVPCSKARFICSVTFLIVLAKKGMNFHILEADANLAIGAVWTNHGDSAKRIMLGGLDELEDFAVP